MSEGTTPKLGPLAVARRRVRWKLHWALHPHEMFVVRSWWDGMTLVLPRSGSAAVAFYRTFPSRVVADWMSDAIRPGMTVIDVGAHVGVYTLLAARLAGPTGAVYAIEPQHECLMLLKRNLAINDLFNVHTRCVALGSSDDKTGLHVDGRTMGAYLASDDQATRIVSTRKLETFALDNHLSAIDVMKLDAAGSELAALRGGRSLIQQGAIGRIILKLYHPRVVADRTGLRDGPIAILAFLREHGYEIVLGEGSIPACRTLSEAFSKGVYSVPVLAIHSGARIL